MATNQYIGARYVPLFAEPAQWDKTKQYEPLTIVMHEGNSYTSRQFVPAGIELANDAFWALTGNYNAQVEQYRKEVTTYDQRITNAQTSADNAQKTANTANAAAADAKGAADTATEVSSAAKATADNALALSKTNETDIAANDAELAGTADSGLKTLITNEAVRATNAEQANATDISNETKRAKSVEVQLNNSITNVSQSIAGKMNKLTGFVVFGDSWSDTAVTDSIWSTFMAAQHGLTLHNYSSNGATVTTKLTNNFDAQIAKAAADNSWDKSTAKYCILLGGINDYRSSVSKDDLADKFLSLVSTCRTMYPNAEILVATNCEWPYTIATKEYWYNVTQYVANKTNANVVMLDGCFEPSDYNQTNWFHLTQDGQKEMASILYKCVNGGEHQPKRIRIHAINGADTDFYYIVQRIGNAIHWCFTGKISTSRNLNVTGLGNDVKFSYADGIPTCAFDTAGTSMCKVVINPDVTNFATAVVNPESSGGNTFAISGVL